MAYSVFVSGKELTVRRAIRVPYSVDREIEQEANDEYNGNYSVVANRALRSYLKMKNPGGATNTPGVDQSSKPEADQCKVYNSET